MAGFHIFSSHGCKLGSMVGILFLFVVLWMAGGEAHADTWLADGMTEAGPHPRTVLTPDLLDTVRSRAYRSEYKTMMANIQNRADRTVTSEDHDLGTEISRAKTAKSSAFLAYLGLKYDETAGAAELSVEERRAYEEKAALYLTQMITESRAKGIQPNGSIHTAQELMCYAHAFDLLEGMGSDFGGQRTEAMQNLADLTADLYADYEITNWIALRSYLNNHRTKAVSALGVAAIVLNGLDFEAKTNDGRYEVRNWIELAVRGMDHCHMDLMSDWEGGYQESYNYFDYAAINFLPFFWAWHRYVGKSMELAPRDPNAPPMMQSGQTEPYIVGDYLQNQLLTTQADAMVKTSQPDGSQPPTDDCSPLRQFLFVFFIHEMFPHAGVYRWAWERSPRAPFLGELVNECELMGIFDADIEPVSPETLFETDAVMPVYGAAVFRSGWERDALYLYVLAEHGKAAGFSFTRWGQSVGGISGHEHSDGGSFVLYAYDEPLIIDAGYLGWEEHESVNNANNHSMILLDGKGPNPYSAVIPPMAMDENGELIVSDPSVEGGYSPPGDGEAWILGHKTATEDAPILRYVDLFTEYHENTAPVEIRRRVALLDSRAVLIYDEITPLDGAAHEVTFQLHGHGGSGLETGTFESTEYGGTWLRENAGLHGQVISDKEVTFSTRVAPHDSIDKGNRTKEYHTALDATISLQAGEVGRFLALLQPFPNSGGARDVSRAEILKNSSDFPAGFHWTFDNVIWTAVLAEGGFSTQTGETNAKMAAWSVDESSNLRAFFGVDLKTMTHDARTWFSVSGEPISFWLERTQNDELLGSLMPSPVEATNLVQELRIDLNESLKAENVCESNALESGLALSTVPGIAFRLASQADAGLPVRLIARLANDEDSPLLALQRPQSVETGRRVRVEDAMADCSVRQENADAVSNWILNRKPELSQATLDSAGEHAVAFTTDLPGEYIVERTLKSGSIEGSDRRTITAVGEPGTYTPPVDGDEDEDDALSEEEEQTEADEEEVVEKKKSKGGGGCREVPQFSGIAWSAFFLISVLLLLRRKRLVELKYRVSAITFFRALPLSLFVALGCLCCNDAENDSDALGDDENESETGDLDAETGAKLSFVAVTFNTGTSESMGHDSLPDDGYSSEHAARSDEWYGDGLAWTPAVEATRRFFEEVDPDIAVFQEIFYSGDCPDIPQDARQDFYCETWEEGQPTVAQYILGEGWQVMCQPGKSDKCAAVNRRFGSFKGCDEDFCLEGLEGYRVEDCGKGARVGRGIIELVEGGELTLVNVHGSSGFAEDEQQCRVKQFEQAFVDLGDGEPGANGSRNLVMGDFNTDPGRMTDFDPSAAYLHDFVENSPDFSFITDVGEEAPGTYATLYNIDHVIGDAFTGQCWAAGVTSGHPDVIKAIYFDHKPVVCTLEATKP